MNKTLEFTKVVSESNSVVTSCILCGSSDSFCISDVCRYSINARNLICKKCGLVYIESNSDALDLQKYYESSYRTQYKLENLASLKYMETKGLKAKILSKYVFSNAKILEIGCANGVLLNELKKINNDIQLYGIEPTQELALKAEKDFGVRVFNGFFENFESEVKKFDLIVLDHSLEHFKNPLMCLTKIRSLLKDGGVVYIEVPDIKQPYGDLELNFFQHVHLYNFSFKTLRILLKLSGFDLLEYSLDSCIGCFVKKSKICKMENLDFNVEGDDYLLILKFLKVYKNYYRFLISTEEKKDVFMSEVLKTDLELENKIQKMYLEVLKEKISNCAKQKDDESLKKEMSYYIGQFGKNLVASIKIMRTILER